MKIAFPCPGCGKKLKSRNGEVGRTRKCPVCSTRVTCPEPVAEARFIHEDVLEAEIVEAERIPAAARSVPAARRGAAANGNGAGTRAARSAPAPAPDPAPAVDPFADLGDDPYQLAEPDPAGASTSSTEEQKPCPMCGEMIAAVAAKCRYCGEVLDPRLKKGKSKKKKRKSSGGLVISIGSTRDIGIGLVLIVAGIGLTVASYSSAASKGGGTYFIYHGLVLCGVVQLFRGLSGRPG